MLRTLSSEAVAAAQRHPGLASEPPLALVDQHRDDDDHADGDELPERLDVDEHQAVLDDGDDESAGDGAGDGARAAEQAGAADDHGGDRIEEQRLARLRRAGREAAGIEDAGKAGADRREQIELDRQALDVDAGAQRRGAVGAEGIGVLAEAGLRQHVVHHQDDHGGDDDEDRHAQERPLPIRKNQLFVTGTVMPPASRKAAPRATPYMPSVPMKGGTRSCAMSQPLTKPGMRAIRNAASMPSSSAPGGRPARDWLTWAKMTAQAP